MTVIRRWVVTAVCVTLAFPVSLFAQQDAPIRRSADRAAAAIAQQPAGGSGENPYFWTGLGLLIAGGSLLVASNTWLAVDDPGDIRCEVDDNFNIDCDTKVNKAMLVTGIGLAGLGGFLFLRGERMKSVPIVVPTARGILVRQRFSF